MSRKNKPGIWQKTKQLSIKTHLFVRVFLIIIAFVIAVFFIDSKLMNFYYVFHSIWQVWDLSPDIEEAYLSGNFATALKKIEKENNITIEIFNSDDKLVYSSDYNGKYYGQTLADSYIRHYSTSSIGISGSKYLKFETDNSDDVALEYIVLVNKTDNDNTINIYYLKSSLDESSETAIQFTLYMVIGMALLSIFIIRVLADRFTAPLIKISQITEKMSTLDFSEKCPDSKTKEISALTKSINDMSESLDKALEELRIKNKKLEEDIANERTIDQLRSTFISGVSHELKTPISIIGGYAEGLKFYISEDNTDANEYCDIIIAETGRMHDLVMRLLDIIKYQSGGYEPKYEEVNIRSLFAEWFERNKNILAEKGIDTINNIPDDFIGNGDTMLLSSVCNNLLSNAVSHCDFDKIIEVSAEKLDNIYRISVFNTGNIIAEKDIDKIWTSFYRADKSMNRSQGRFGLGLTIVQSIQDLHKMQYGVENVENGVRFWFDVQMKSKQCGIENGQ